MERIKDISTLVYRRTQGGQYRWITVSTLLLAIGAILHLVSPSFAGVTPNWTIAMYCIAIALTRATYKQSFGIGMVAALINVMTSKSGFPYGNFLSEPVGALTCAVLVHTLGHIRLGKLDFMPFLTGFVTTIFSGGTFITVLYFALNMPLKAYLYGMWPFVFMVALCNMIATPVLYFPAKKLFATRGFLPDSREAKVSDHSGYNLVQGQEGIISVEHLSYTYGKAERPAIKDVTIAVHPRDFLVITGPAGCGKSTLCMAMSGAVPHFYGGTMTGMVFVNGQAVTQTSIADLALQVGTVLADYDTQLVTMTVEEEIGFALENRGYGTIEIEERTKRVLAQVGLSGLETRQIAKLSGGQRQRLAIASVLATDPQILVFDEPTSSLDPEGTEEFYKLIGSLNKEYGITVVVIDHDLHAAIPYANRLALMVDGELVMDNGVEGTLRYMYEHQIYVETLPSLFVCQMELEKNGYTFEHTWFDVEKAKQGLKTLGGEAHA